MNQIEKMFAHKGKSSKLIGDARTKIYKEIYEHISRKQDLKELPFDGNYLDENELAKLASVESIPVLTNNNTSIANKIDIIAKCKKLLSEGEIDKAWQLVLKLGNILIEK